MIQLLGVFLLT